MTGINSPYEPPLQPTLTITNDSKKLEAGVDALMNLLHP
jgi:adenylylsulfate kinase-like enzyme